ncbi:MAG TPA: HAMP domain-containing sensor histidine kinase [Jatrophihabitantaceae bacterium]
MRLFRPTLRSRMALLYGGLVLLVGVSLLFTSIVLLNRSIARLPFFNTVGKVTLQDQAGHVRHVDPSAIGRQSRTTSVDYLLHTGLIYFAIIVVIGTTGGYLLAKQALRPIARLTRTARQLSSENLDQRIDLGGPDDELRELADTFDEMLARLAASFDSQRLFVANASHELRTPLAVIRTELEVTLADPDADVAELRRMGEVAEAAAERAQHLVTSLLTLATLQAVGQGKLEVAEPVDLARLVPGVLRAVEAELKDNEITVETDVEPAATVGDPRLLERLIGNLVENAIRHNVPGGWLRVTTGASAEWVWLHVANGGSVIPPGDVDTLFEPFRRGRRARNATRGAGLGLAIVRLIVEAHHGRLQAAAPPFGGLAIRIELPRQPSSRQRPMPSAHRAA